MKSILTEKEQKEIDPVLKLEAKRADSYRKVNDPVYRAKQDLKAAGEDLRDWPLPRILGLINNGF